MTDKVTIPEEIIEQEVDDYVYLAKKLTCTCGWVGTTQVFRSESMARHHLLYTHGGGEFEYMGISEKVPESRK